MGTFLRGCFLNGMVEKEWVVIKGGGIAFVFSSKNCFLNRVEKGEVFFFLTLFKRRWL
jgi:hypothetical protein